MRKSANLFLLFFLASAKILFAQPEINPGTFFMKPYPLEKKVCILFQNDFFIILASTGFLTEFYTQVNDSSWMKTEKNLFFGSKNDQQDTINLYAYAEENSLGHLVIKRTEHFMLRNECIILNRKTGKHVTRIDNKRYDRFDVGGKAYYINGQLLFETIDRIY